MIRRSFMVVAVVAALGGQSSQALASAPSSLLSAAAGADRYRPPITFTYSAPLSVTDPAHISLHPAGSATQVPVDAVVGNGTATLTVTPSGTLRAGTTYVASILPDGDSTWDSVQWTTRRTPAHPTLRVKIVTALAPDAVDDIVRTLDRENLLAPPRPSDLVDISAATGRALAAADLKGYQAALVVTDQDLADSSTDATVLSAFAAKGHGVVLGGQTHWTTGGLNWSAHSAIGGAGGGWAANWSPLPYVDPPAVEGGFLKASSVQSHFLTTGLSAFHVLGAGSGAQDTTQAGGWAESVLARLQPSGAYTTGQSLLAIRWESRDWPGRIVDLGFDPWSTAVASGGGGYDPAETPDAPPLIARALWWATDRIAPTRTRFTSKPGSPSKFATVSFTLAGRDADPASQFTMLRFQYKVNRGRWKWAHGGSSFALYHLTPGRSYTVRARGVDFAGNRDGHPAVYRFRVSRSAWG